MKVFRIVRNFALAFFVFLILVTKLFQSFTYWWIAFLVALLSIVPDLDEYGTYKRKRKKEED